MTLEAAKTDEVVPARTAAPARLPSLTGTRFLAAFMVLGFHVSISGLFAPGLAQDTLTAIFAQGASGVSFFFILSGFVLTWSARPGDRPARFWRRRWAKIYPSHVVAWVLALGGMVAAGKAIAADQGLATLFLVQAWWPTERVYFAVNTPSWSLSAEAFFYLTFPLIFALLRRVRPGALWFYAAAAAAAVVLMPVVALALPEHLRYWFVFVFPVTRWFEFALGIAMARILRENRWAGPGPRVAAVLVVAAYIASKFVPDQFQPAAATVIPFALLITALAARDVTGAPSFWRRPIMVYLGEISFAMYLLHQIVLRYIQKFLHANDWPTLKAAAVALAIVAISIAASAVMYRVVEKPLTKRLGSPRRKPQHSAA
ncbi:acyltransferase family protein [Dactylosporangium sp. CA-092794]|uniref:acyltransferase family protein n=1 Tax=Dactylosporangium sp. CA-092794 TaxID=3239929 RepID=UPI003D91BCC7